MKETIENIGNHIGLFLNAIIKERKENKRDNKFMFPQFQEQFCFCRKLQCQYFQQNQFSELTNLDSHAAFMVKKKKSEGTGIYYISENNHIYVHVKKSTYI